ncbi:MAG: hypothetical protein R3F14_20195 [Polyangiaceae bacterium]
MRVGRLFSAAAAATAALLLTFASHAQQPGAQDPTAGVEMDPAVEDDAASVPGRPLPRDDRTGHISAFAGVNVVVPAGDLGSGVTLADIADAGPGGDLGLQIGLSRHSGLELRGQFIQLGPSARCADCRTQMFGGSLGLVYHATQALGFDPWVRFGAGYRALLVRGNLADIVTTAPPAGTFHGIDVTTLALGGDFFPLPWLGVGLYLEGTVGVDVSAPSPDARGAVYGLFQAGLRVALEPQRKPVTVASAPPTRRTAVVDSSDFSPARYNRGAR